MNGTVMQVGTGRRQGRHRQPVGIAVALMALLSALVLGYAQEASASGGDAPALTSGEGAAFAMTNVTTDNRIISYRRTADGRLTATGSISTRGHGSGTDLDTQGALQLSKDHRYLYAPNAGSDDISVFSVNGTRLRFLQRIDAGDQPNSLTLHENLLYVLNGSVAGNGIRGFRVAGDGTLTLMEGSFRALSSPIAVPGQVAFSPNGRLLLVTQKTTAVTLSPQIAIDAFQLRGDGYPMATPTRNASHGVRPFSLAFRGNDELVVTESFDAAPKRSALSSYRVSPTGDLSTVSGSVRNEQTDMCWVVVTKDGRYAYTANFGSGTISSYGYGPAGRLRLLDGDAATTGYQSQPVDLALSQDGRYLYLLLRGTGGVAAFKVFDGGGLKPLGVVTDGLFANYGASGLVVY